LAVPHLISVVAESLSPLADSAGVALRTSVVPGPQLEADAMRIEQVLSNLVTNAIKYTPPGGSVDIEAKPLDDAWQFTVTDTGIGIPAEEQHNLFERFFRASNTKDLRIPGTGLGLVICKFIVEFHGGTIDVESEVGRGTVVTVSIPIFEGDDVV
jgi:signal transduction histidine kinase